MLKKIPNHIKKPSYAKTGNPAKASRRLVKTSKEIETMRSTCREAREILQIVIEAVKPGISTEELDDIAHEECIKRGGYPSPLNYMNFPKSLCTSVNEVVCHGIPSKDQILKEGDIINCDVTLYLNGMHGDCSVSVGVGEISKERDKLIRVTKQAMLEGIRAIKPNKCVSKIGKAIQSYVRKVSDFSIVRRFTGHGIGSKFHMSPSVFHYYERKYKFNLQPGMTLTVEPMINIGGCEEEILEDGWTSVTCDGQPSAQFEDTILVTPKGYEILTLL
jgi:methionyl aminopeptidase